MAGSSYNPGFHCPSCVGVVPPMTQKESGLSRKIALALRVEGAFVFKVWGSEYMMAGLPDLIGCYKGQFFAFETKLPEKRRNVSLVQQRVMAKIRNAGGYTQVVCTVPEAVVALHTMDHDS